MSDSREISQPEDKQLSKVKWERKCSDPSAELNHSDEVVLRKTKSSLKHPLSSKSSPDLYSRKRKSVSFAQNLEQIRVFDELKELMLQSTRTQSDSSTRYEQPSGMWTKFIMLFPQPARNYSEYIERLWQQKVCLESAYVMNNSINGSIKVINLAYRKDISVKLTYNSWQSFTLVSANYWKSETMHIDVFTFIFYIPPNVKTIKFCIRYSCNGREYWDNNRGQDYTVTVATVKKRITSTP